MNAGTKSGETYLQRGLRAMFSAKDKRQSIRKYFNIKRAKNWWMILYGAMFILAGLVPGDLDHSSWAGELALFIGAGIVLRGWGSLDWTLSPSDREIDQWTREDFQILNERALQRAGIDTSEINGKPIPIYGPGDVKPRKVGEDKRLRFGRYSGVVISFTSDRLLIYSCVVDVTTGNTLSESTDEYWYRDVVSVSTTTRNGHLGRKQVSIAEYFILTTSRGCSAEVFLRSPEIDKIFGGELPPRDVEEAILTVRKMVREKKGAAGGSLHG